MRTASRSRSGKSSRRLLGQSGRKSRKSKRTSGRSGHSLPSPNLPNAFRGAHEHDMRHPNEEPVLDNPGDVVNLPLEFAGPPDQGEFAIEDVVVVVCPVRRLVRAPENRFRTEGFEEGLRDLPAKRMNFDRHGDAGPGVSKGFRLARANPPALRCPRDAFSTKQRAPHPLDEVDPRIDLV